MKIQWMGLQAYEDVINDPKSTPAERHLAYDCLLAELEGITALLTRYRNINFNSIQRVSPKW